MVTERGDADPGLFRGLENRHFRRHGDFSVVYLDFQGFHLFRHSLFTLLLLDAAEDQSGRAPRVGRRRIRVPRGQRIARSDTGPIIVQSRHIEKANCRFAGRLLLRKQGRTQRLVSIDAQRPDLYPESA
jgi:hypothetical protein